MNATLELPNASPTRRAFADRDFCLLKDWHFFTSPDPKSWWASEKIFDVRVMWNGRDFFTRGGIRVDAPDWFTEGLPDVQLDCGIHAGRSGFYEARSAVNHGRFTPAIRLAIFDVPSTPGAAAMTWAERMAHAPTTAHAARVEFQRVESKADLVRRFHAIRKGGGEGVVIRDPDPSIVGYQIGRTSTALRLK